MKYLLPALLVVASGALADTSAFDGDYKFYPDQIGCVVGEGDVANAALRIAEGRLYSIEGECALTSPVTIRGMNAALYDMQCSAEGEVWNDRVMLMRGLDNGLMVISDGHSSSFAPCEG